MIWEIQAKIQEERINGEKKEGNQNGKYENFTITFNNGNML